MPAFYSLLLPSLASYLYYSNNFAGKIDASLLTAFNYYYPIYRASQSLINDKNWTECDE